MDSNVAITCLECGRENTTRGFSYGQSKDVWCRRCHSKLSLFAEQCKFVQHQPRELNPVTREAPKQPKLKHKEQVLKLGTPLPEYGTCQHYKKSHRWLRYVLVCVCVCVCVLSLMWKKSPEDLVWSALLLVVRQLRKVSQLGRTSIFSRVYDY